MMVVLAAVAATVALTVYYAADKIVAWQIDRQVKTSMLSQSIDDSSFEVLMCGTGSPQFQLDRAQPCTAVLVGGQMLLFDSGQGAAQSLQRWEAPLVKLDHIFLTHLHSDHTSGVGDVLHNSWLYGRKQNVSVMGPPGTKTFMEGVDQTFIADLEERWKTVGKEFGEFTASLADVQEIAVLGSELVTVYKKNGVNVTAFKVDHPSWDSAYGYRIDYADKTVVISGDTRYSENLLKYTVGADVLIHEVINEGMMMQIADSLEKHGAPVDPKRMGRIVSVHTPTHELAQLAQQAGVKQLVLSHLIPPIPANAFVENVFVEGMDEIYEGQLTVARDGMRINLNDR